MNKVPDCLSQRPDYLHMLTTTITVPVLLDHLHTIQEYENILQKYWLLACGTHADYSIINNLIGEFSTFKGQLYVPKSLVPTILFEYQNAQGYFG